MKNTLLLLSFLTLLTGNSLAQCAVNEVEVRVDIITDNWGYETSWVLTDLAGMVALVRAALESWSPDIVAPIPFDRPGSPHSLNREVAP